MTLLTKRILIVVAGLLLLLGAYHLAVAAPPYYPPAHVLLLPPALAAGLLIGSGLLLLFCVFYGPTLVGQQASAYSPTIDLQYFGLVTTATQSNKISQPTAPYYAASIIDCLDEGLLLLDENRLVVVANYTISQLLSIPTSQLIGRAADELATHCELLGQLLRYLDASTDQRPVTGPVFTLTHGTQEASYQLLVRTASSPAQPGPVGTVLVLRNVTEQQQLDQAKWHFLAKVAQELQTPLTSMQLSLNRLQEGSAGPLTPEQQNITYTLARENKHLLKLVEELLNVSRLELGTIQLNFQVVRLHTLVQFVASTIRPQLQPKRLVLDVPAAADTLPPVRADLEKTTWVLLSLLANAIRYAHLQDHLLIAARLTNDGRHLRVSVHDQGPGIAPADQAKLFQRFSHIPTSGGSGLGLSIAREFIASQGGELGVESELGKGSTFWFTLPLAQPAAA
jgi:NtrC-family two-component system sensor histidine kinase KinB